MDSFHLHQGLCFLVGFLKAVRGFLKAVSGSVCVLQRVTYFFGQTVFTFFPQFTIPNYHVQFVFFIISNFDNETSWTCVT